jgi:chromosome segregation ATPase
MKGMKTRRKSYVANHSAQDITELDKARQEMVFLKTKIRSLEVEVETLKQRLDSLRKAKNTTIIKKEREEVYLLGHHHQHYPVNACDSWTNGSELSSTSSVHCINRIDDDGSKLSLLEEKDKLLHKRGQEIKELSMELSHYKSELNSKLLCLQKEHKECVKNISEKLSETKQEIKQEMDRVKDISKNIKCAADENNQYLLEEIKKLKLENEELAVQLSGLLDANVQLRESNLALQGKCETLLEDLSIKEARWSEREESLTAEVRNISLIYLQA